LSKNHIKNTVSVIFLTLKRHNLAKLRPVAPVAGVVVTVLTVVTVIKEVDVPVAPLVVPAVVCDAVVNVVGVVALSKTHRVLVYFKIMFELAHMVDNTTDT